MASRKASRTETDVKLVPSGTSGSFTSTLRGVFISCASLASVDFSLPPLLSDSGDSFSAGASISEASSSSPASMAITVPTFTPSVPSSMRIFPRVPSSTASNSIVALSVSISAMISPATISSPSDLSHLANVPSSIVGDSAGIFSSIAMAQYSSTSTSV